MPDECVYGHETGRFFVYDNLNTRCVTAIPDHTEWNVWTEMGPDEDGEFWYSSDDPDGYVLDAEEFGPFTEDEILTAEQLKTIWRDEDEDAPIKPAAIGFEPASHPRNTRCGLGLCQNMATKVMSLDGVDLIHLVCDSHTADEYKEAWS